MTNNMKYFKIFLCLIMLTSCSSSSNDNSKETVMMNDNEVSYFAYYDELVKGKLENNFTFLDANGEVVKIEKIKMDNYRDIFYYELDSLNHILYMFGNGGLFKIDLDTYEATKLSDENINVLEVKDNTFYYYKNGGYAENGYNAEICEWEKECITLSYPVSDLEYQNRKLYVSNGYQDDYFITTIDGKNVTHTQIPSPAYFLASYNGKVYGTNEIGLIDIENNFTIFPYINEYGELLTFPPEPFYDSTGQLYLLDRINDTLYETTVDEMNSLVLCQAIYTFENNVTLYPTLVNDVIVLVDGNNTLQTFNLITRTLETDIDLKLDSFYHVIKLQ